MRRENVKFYLKRPTSGSPTSIFARVQINKKQFKYYLKRKINPEYWDSSTGEPIKDRDQIRKWSKQEPQIEVIFQNIRVAMNDVANIIVRYVNLKGQENEPISQGALRILLDEKLGIVQEGSNGIRLVSFVEAFISDLETGKRLNPSNGNRYSKGTIKNYIGFKVQLIEYQNKRQRKLDFEDITIGFYNDYLKYFQDKNYKSNTIGRHIKALKVVMRSAEDNGLHRNQEYKRKEFRVLTEEVDSIYLNEAELKKLYNLDLSANPAYDRGRDVFLLGCYTGLRFSDFSRIRPHHLQLNENGSHILTMFNQKNGKRTDVPARPEVVEILKKYGNSIPKTYEQKVNRYIKEVGRLAGIDTPIEVKEERGGFRIQKIVPKYQLIQTHTARRSAATNMFLAGIEPILIMRITRHKTQKDFMKYLKITGEETAKRLSKHSFFAQDFRVSDLRKIAK